MKHLLLILFLPMIFNISLMGQDKSEQDRQKDILDCLVKMGEDTMVTLNICDLPLCTDQLVIFNEDQVAKTGYDAAIVYQSKRLVPINEVVRKLRKSK